MHVLAHCILYTIKLKHYIQSGKEMHVFAHFILYRFKIKLLTEFWQWRIKHKVFSKRIGESSLFKVIVGGVMYFARKFGKQLYLIRRGVVVSTINILMPLHLPVAPWYILWFTCMWISNG